jgi:hypothetical protein
MIAYVKSETQLTVSRLGKAAIKGMYISMLITEKPVMLCT